MELLIEIYEALKPYLFEILFGLAGLILLLIKLSKKRLTSIINNSSLIDSKNVGSNIDKIERENLANVRYFVLDKSGNKIYVNSDTIRKELKNIEKENFKS